MTESEQKEALLNLLHDADSFNQLSQYTRKVVDPYYAFTGADTAMFIIGGSMAIIGVPLWVSGKAKCENAISQQNSLNRKSQLSLNVNNNGVGLAFCF